MFWLPRGHFSACFGSQEGTLACVLAPKNAVYHVLTSQGGSLVFFANQEGTLACFFGSQEDTLAHVLAPRGHFSPRFSTIGPPLCTSQIFSETLGHKTRYCTARHGLFLKSNSCQARDHCSRWSFDIRKPKHDLILNQSVGTALSQDKTEHQETLPTFILVVWLAGNNSTFQNTENIEDKL